MGNLDRVDRRPRRAALIVAGLARLGAAALLTSLAAGAAAGAQAVDVDSRIEVEAPRAVMMSPIYEGGVRSNRGIHIPANLREGPERRLSAGYTASNSYLNPGFLVCADGSCELEYETDHTGNLLFAGVTQPVFRAFEIGFTVGTYQMSEIPDGMLVHRLASDSALRSIHDRIVSGDSLAEASHAPDGRQVFTMTDLDGRRLTLEPRHAYALPLRVDLTRYVDIRRTARARMSLNAGVHLAYPLEGDLEPASGRTAFARGMDLGISVNFIRSRRITANVSSSYHLQIARFRSDVHVVNPDSPLQGDDDERSQYALTYGLRFGGTFRGRAPCSFAMSQLSTTAQFDKARYWAWDPLVFEGGDNLRSAIRSANDYGVLTFACERRGRQFQVSLAEDFAGFSNFIGDDGSGTSYDPDLAVGVSVSWALHAAVD